jgi:hypothetical protein
MLSNLVGGIDPSHYPHVLPTKLIIVSKNEGLDVKK